MVKFNFKVIRKFVACLKKMNIQPHQIPQLIYRLEFQQFLRNTSFETAITKWSKSYIILLARRGFFVIIYPDLLTNSINNNIGGMYLHS